MVRVIATHVDATGDFASFQTMVQLPKSTLDDIKQYVENVNPELTSTYKCRIEIVEPEISPEKEHIIKKEHIINLIVTWTKKNDFRLSQTLSYSNINTTDGHGIGANQNMPSSDYSQTISAPAETISQDKTNQHDDECGDNVELIDQQRPITDLRSICPLLVELDKKLSHQSLCGDDVKAVSSICLFLAREPEKMLQFISDISEILGFNERLVLFTSKHLEIRAHLFKKGAKEGFIHNHQWNFISCCLQGTYRHRIHAIIEDNGKHYVSYRETGGSYSDGTERFGTPTNILDQPFSAGQCMFLSAHALHTVEPQSEEPVVTLVFRHKQSVNKKASVIHSSRNGVGYNLESVYPILDNSRIEKIKMEFTTVLEQYDQRMTLASR